MIKKKSRREFLELGMKAGIGLPLAGSVLFSCDPKTNSNEAKGSDSSKKLKILILGGTSFLGPHQIAYALNRGHSISTFTRGKTKPTIHQDLFSKVEQLVGDRENDLTALENRKWDVVIDNSGHNAEWTKQTASLLKSNCDLYLYTSSTGVYYPYINSEFNESSEVMDKMPETYKEELKLEYWYGSMKVNSETEAIAQFGVDRTIVVRPTYMIGPADRSDRFIHWPIRLERGGETMIPGKEEDPVQYVDVRDVAEWMIRLIEERKVGTYNAVGPKEAQNMYSFIQEAKEAFDVESTFVKIDDYEFLTANKVLDVVPWIMPTENNAGSAKIDNSKGIQHGLTFRPLKESVIDTFNWWHSGGVSQERRDGYESNPDNLLMRENAIIDEWKNK